jgi:hypothetical protein
MNLPEDVQNMLLEIGKEVEMKVSAPVAEVPADTEDNLQVDSSFIKEAMINAKNQAELEYLDHPDYFPHALIRSKPDVLLGEKATRKRVCNVQDLLRLTNNLQKMEVTNYWGHNHESLLVVRAQIPDLYEARVGYIRVKHVPDKFLKDIKFVDRSKPAGKKGKGEIALVLNELEPVWTREMLYEIDKKEIVKNYNFVTFKIHKESHTLVSWLPGQDTRSGLCESLEEEWVGLEKKSEMALRILRNE